MLKLRCAPLDLKYDDLAQELFFEGKKLVPQTRLLGQVYDALHDELFAAVADQKTPLYYMYRGVARKRDEERIRKSGLRFDVTVMLPMLLGKEFNKTFGHYHEKIRGAEVPELYEVLSGSAHFLLQTRRPGSSEVDEVRLVKAREGDKVIIPPGFGHITVNPSKTKALVTLKAADKGLVTDYHAFIEKKGGVYYDLVDGLAANHGYEKPPKAKVLKQIEVRDFPKRKCIYRVFLENPERFQFLTSTENAAGAAEAGKKN
ncbi:MAG: hypothetical protein NTY90_01865 [Candidatus Micrarchaeota archaeon]|nr:hypothetical protein [Candidatus Micrarchaeota archaeon]